MINVFKNRTRLYALTTSALFFLQGVDVSMGNGIIRHGSGWKPNNLGNYLGNDLENYLGNPNIQVFYPTPGRVIKKAGGVSRIPLNTLPNVSPKSPPNSILSPINVLQGDSRLYSCNARSYNDDNQPIVCGDGKTHKVKFGTIQVTRYGDNAVQVLGNVAGLQDLQSLYQPAGNGRTTVNLYNMFLEGKYPSNQRVEGATGERGFGSAVFVLTGGKGELEYSRIKGFVAGLEAQDGGQIVVKGGKIEDSNIGALAVSDSSIILERVLIDVSDVSKYSNGLHGLGKSGISMKSGSITFGKGGIGVIAESKSSVALKGVTIKVKSREGAEEKEEDEESGPESVVFLSKEGMISFDDGNFSGSNAAVLWISDSADLAVRADLLHVNSDSPNFAVIPQNGGNPRDAQSPDVAVFADVTNVMKKIENDEQMSLKLFASMQNSRITASGKDSYGIYFDEKEINNAIGELPAPSVRQEDVKRTVFLKNTDINVPDGIAVYDKGSKGRIVLGESSKLSGSLLLKAESGSNLEVLAYKATLKGASHIDKGARAELKLSESKWYLEKSKGWKSSRADCVDSCISSVTLTNGTIGFIPPEDGKKEYQTLRIGNGEGVVYTSYANSQIYFNINPIPFPNNSHKQQMSDRLLIHGDVEGTTTVYINAQTMYDAVGRQKAQEKVVAMKDRGAIHSIPIIQVYGTAKRESFSLENDYITLDGSPYQYILRGYGPEIAPEMQYFDSRLARGKQVWDFRLEGKLENTYKKDNKDFYPTASERVLGRYIWDDFFPYSLNGDDNSMEIMDRLLRKRPDEVFNLSPLMKLNEKGEAVGYDYSHLDGVDDYEGLEFDLTEEVYTIPEDDDDSLPAAAPGRSLLAVSETDTLGANLDSTLTSHETLESEAHSPSPPLLATTERNGTTLSMSSFPPSSEGVIELKKIGEDDDTLDIYLLPSPNGMTNYNEALYTIDGGGEGLYTIVDGDEGLYTIVDEEDDLDVGYSIDTTDTMRENLYTLETTDELGETLSISLLSTPNGDVNVNEAGYTLAQGAPTSPPEALISPIEPPASLTETPASLTETPAPFTETPTSSEETETLALQSPPSATPSSVGGSGSKGSTSSTPSPSKVTEPTVPQSLPSGASSASTSSEGAENKPTQDVTSSARGRSDAVDSGINLGSSPVADTSSNSDSKGRILLSSPKKAEESKDISKATVSTPSKETASKQKTGAGSEGANSSQCSKNGGNSAKGSQASYSCNDGQSHTVSGLTLQASGGTQHSVRVDNKGTVLTLEAANITGAAASSSGTISAVLAEQSAEIVLNKKSKIQSSAIGLEAKNGGTVKVIESTVNASHVGALVDTGSSVNLKDTEIHVVGALASAGLASSGGKITMNSGSIHVMGGAAVKSELGGNVNLEGVKITVKKQEGVSDSAEKVERAAILLSNKGSVDLKNGNVVTDATGLLIRGNDDAVGVEGGRRKRSSDVRPSLNRAHIESSTFKVEGDGSYGIYFDGTKQKEALQQTAGSSVENNRVVKRNAVSQQEKTPMRMTGAVSLKNTKFEVANGIAIYGNNSNAQVSLEKEAILTADLLLRAKNNSNIVASLDNSLVVGGARVDKDSYAKLDLTNKSVWRLTRSARKSEEAECVDSCVSSVSLVNSRIEFLTSEAKDVYQTLHIGEGKGIVYRAEGDASIHLNAHLSPNNPIGKQVTDRLIIHGDVSGKTIVHVQGISENIVDRGHAKNPHSVSIIQVYGTAAKDSFQLYGNYVALHNSPYKYALRSYNSEATTKQEHVQQKFMKNGADFWNFRLENQYVKSTVPMLGSALSEQFVRSVVPQVPTYLLLPNSVFHAGLMDINNQSKQLETLRATSNGMMEVRENPSLYLRGYGGSYRYISNLSALEYGYKGDLNYNGVEAGILLQTIENADSALSFGVMGSYGKLSLQPVDVEQSQESAFDKWTATAYGSMQHDAGFYVDGLLSYGLFKGDVLTLARGNTATLKANPLSVSLTGGQTIATGYQGFIVDPQVQVVYQHLQFEKTRDIDNFDIEMGNLDQWVARVGGRLTKSPKGSEGVDAIAFYSKLYLVHGFEGKKSVQFKDTFQLGAFGSSLEAGLGFNAKLSSAFSLHGDFAYQHKLNKAGFSGTSFSGGVRYQF
ncbi:autotransporter outer membrane beta-barrel domain-containing protein [Bartonella raoultii]|uniref:autotransporter outer membrane beta-barrel domain-containing protein n=1 Tax=Bartonella raoultii TaxID=1457020 RepID=UPI001FF03BFF|nr:autotransporter outer membrane beta-barrel domain-containing protein [Bartonella raoultii]